MYYKFYQIKFKNISFTYFNVSHSFEKFVQIRMFYQNKQIMKENRFSTFMKLKLPRI